MQSVRKESSHYANVYVLEWTMIMKSVLLWTVNTFIITLQAQPEYKNDLSRWMQVFKEYIHLFLLLERLTFELLYKSAHKNTYIYSFKYCLRFKGAHRIYTKRYFQFSSVKVTCHFQRLITVHVHYTTHVMFSLFFQPHLSHSLSSPFSFSYHSTIGFGVYKKQLF